MKHIAILLAAVLLAGCAQKKYDYASFLWPDSGDARAVMIYWNGQGGQQTVTNLDLDAVLEQAQDLGWQYTGSTGHTVIMRRPQHTSGSGLPGDFVVEASSDPSPAPHLPGS